ncbi:hypothetical protein KUTeg_006227 [Tegillarca granosa]|uniref:ATP synthase F0 subunit 8 n=1 Tax=Tegillarca granosa TaxID=220873 RepID=A0ABQ9FKH5_TEGGR|nr:hypothetical protein KUTeg_006227 [Tegillarca granosa]
MKKLTNGNIRIMNDVDFSVCWFSFKCVFIIIFVFFHQTYTLILVQSILPHQFTKKKKQNKTENILATYEGPYEGFPLIVFMDRFKWTSIWLQLVCKYLCLFVYLSYFYLFIYLFIYLLFIYYSNNMYSFLNSTLHVKSFLEIKLKYIYCTYNFAKQNHYYKKHKNKRLIICNKIIMTN